jgi:hypothetical protein
MELAGIIYAALVIVVTVVNYVVLGSTRIVKRLSLRRLEPTDKNVDESGFQFSVRGLLLATMLIAASLGAAKWLREALGDASFDVSMILIFTVWGGGFVGVGLAALWAALSTTNSPAMILAVLVAAGAMGAILPYAFEANWESYVYLPLIMMLETSAVMLTLVVVRSCGYRLVRSK